MDFVILIFILSGLTLISSAISGNSITDTVKSFIGG